MTAPSDACESAATPRDVENKGKSDSEPLAGATAGESSQNFSSPVAALQKRRRILNTTPAFAENRDLDDDEDEAEQLRNRHMQHIVEKAREFSSPFASPNDQRRRTLEARNGLTHVQIADHYASCLKLSAENKITHKNAFKLHLIDYMSDMLQNRDTTDTNFQVAGTTLDASAKIYAYRVDSVHQETYKIAGGLGRNDVKIKNEPLDDPPIEEFQSQQKQERPESPKPAKKRRLKGPSKDHNIETNMKNLDLNIADCQGAVDPLFEKIRSNFDEGGCSGLLLNTALTIHDNSRLTLHTMLDFSTRVPLAPTLCATDASDIKNFISRMHSNETDGICTSLADFKFLDWKLADVDYDDSFEAEKQKHDGEYAIKPPAFQLDDDEVSEFGGHADGDDDQDEWAKASVVEQDTTIKCVALDSLSSVLSSRPQEYSYFDTNAVAAWAGPEHWKLKAGKRLRSTMVPPPKDELDEDEEEDAKEPVIKAKKSSASQKKKQDGVRIDFDEDKSFECLFKNKSAASCMVTRPALNKWKMANNVLVADVGYEGDSLRKLFTKPHIRVAKNNAFDGTTVDEKMDEYNFSNTVDKNNFCASTSANMETNEDEDDGASEDNVGADDMDLDYTLNDEDIDDTEGGTSAGVTDTGDGKMLADGGLISQPYKVNKVEVGYARQAKKIDVRRLKHTMWSLLTKEPENGPEESLVGSATSPKKMITQPKSFAQLCSDLPQHLNPSAVENLSVPISFVCLLHMCNEKNLTLTGTEDMSDFTISS